nr:hypothetical protein Iba_chr15aCG15510 [Ipomoea batatas]
MFIIHPHLSTQFSDFVREKREPEFVIWHPATCTLAAASLDGRCRHSAVGGWRSNVGTGLQWSDEARLVVKDPTGGERQWMRPHQCSPSGFVVDTESPSEQPIVVFARYCFAIDRRHHCERDFGGSREISHGSPESLSDSPPEENQATHRNGYARDGACLLWSLTLGMWAKARGKSRCGAGRCAIKVGGALCGCGGTGAVLVRRCWCGAGAASRRGGCGGAGAVARCWCGGAGAASRRGGCGGAGAVDGGVCGAAVGEAYLGFGGIQDSRIH